MPEHPSDDRRPGWFRGLERAFDGLMRGTALLIWVWGLAVFLLVLYGLWLGLFKAKP